MSLTYNEYQAIKARSECLVSMEEVEKKLNMMAQSMNTRLADKNPVVLCTMIGGVITSGLLLPKLNFPLQLDYIHATRYGSFTVGYELEWYAYPRISLENRHVIIVDDILDGGVTLAEIIKHCEKVGASTVESAVLVDKQATRAEGGLVKADYAALEVDDKFLFGLGLDYQGYFRNEPGIFAIATEDETE